MLKRWFVTQKEFDHMVAYHEKKLDRLRDLYWQRYHAHELLLKTLGLSEVNIPAKVELRAKEGPERGENE
jgi:hypothetical protein